MKKFKLTIAFLLMIGAVFAQVTGKIAGEVTSEDGTPLPGANVVVEGTSFGSAADIDGKYVILNVPVGTYNVVSSYIGYKTTTTSNVEVKGGLTTRLSFALETAALEGESVVITGQKRLVEASATNSVRTVNSEDIQNAATRSVTGIVNLQPGVAITNGALHIRGGREEEVAYTLDGADVKDVVGSGRLVSAIPEALSEIAVEAGGYGAHIGGANSGVVRQTIRSGANKLTASARFESGNYGWSDQTFTFGMPLGPLSFFAAVRKNHQDDYNPTYHTPFKIDLDDDGEADVLTSYESGVTATDDEIQVDWKYDKNKGVDTRKFDGTDINASLAFNAGPLRLSLSSVINTNKFYANGTPIFTMFNTARLPVTEQDQKLFSARLNFFLSKGVLLTAGANMLERNSETYDSGFDRPENLFDVVAWGDSAAWYERSGSAEHWRGQYSDPTPYYVGQFPFAKPGDMMTGWAKNSRSTVGFDAELLVQRSGHEFRLGFERKDYTYRAYGLGLAAIRALAKAEFSEEDLKNEIQEAVDLLELNNPGGAIGYNDFGVETKESDGIFGPRSPFSQSFYLNDKYEQNDLVINVGVRVDQFNLDDWKMNDPNNPGWDESSKGVHEEEFSRSETKSILQPRLGLAFPVSDKAVFRMQYGKYAQMPELGRPYASPRFMHLVFGAQNYTPNPMGFDLDPIETTQYEAGFTYQFIQDAAIDVTAYAKNTTGQIVIVKNREIQQGNTFGVDVDVPYYGNGDFTTINGFEMTLRTRRIKGLQTNVSYTWSDTRGVNTDPNSAAGNLMQEALAAPPGMIMPLYYQNRHRGSVVLDYRFEENSNLLVRGTGINLQYLFNSGHPFTLSGGGMGQRAANGGALLDDARAREPQEPIGQSVTPWNSFVNLKVDRDFKIGGVTLSAFAYVENLLDKKNVINVYSRTGNAYDDGFLSTPSLSSEIVAAQGELYTALYENVNLENRQHLVTDFGYDVFGTPRTVKFGVSVKL